MIITGLNFLGRKSWNELSEAIEIYKKYAKRITRTNNLCVISEKGDRKTKA